MYDTFEGTFNNNLDKTGAKIKVIGVGGGGMNAVNKMIDDKISGAEFIVVNTDRQALKASKAPQKLVLGETITKGLGAGANPDIGQKAATETLNEIKMIIKDSDLIFIAAGMGGGTGTGAAPVVAKIAKEAGALVVGIVTTPFSFEGEKRSINAKKGLEELTKHVDSLIVVSNDRLRDELGDSPLSDSFQYSDAILKQAVRTITDIIQEHSLINLDFADVKTILSNKGAALIGVGRASGENSAIEAAIDAINSPILESSIDGAKHAIVNVAGSSKSLTISKAEQAIQTIKEAAANNIDVIFGVSLNESLGDEVIVSVIATGVTNSKINTLSRSNGSSSFGKNGNDVDINKYRSKHTQEMNLKKGGKHWNYGDTFESLSVLDDTKESSLNDNDDDDSLESLLK